MKINKKVLIPIFASAMGLSVIGGISGAVAWYQYNTKVSASYMGVTTSDGGVLQISKDETNWDRDIVFGDANATLHPVTFGDIGSELELPQVARKHPEAGVTDPSEWDAAVKNTDYQQFVLFVKAVKLENNEYVQKAVNVKLDDLVLAAVTENKTEVSSALRVHLNIAGGSRYLLSPTAVTGQDCPLFGPLDLDMSGEDDIKGGYAWEENRTDVLTYGDADKYQVTSALSDLTNTVLFTTSTTASIKITVTIWLEGWHKLASGTSTSAMWDATRDGGSNVHFGLKLSTPKDTFLAD